MRISGPAGLRCRHGVRQDPRAAHQDRRREPLHAREHRIYLGASRTVVEVVHRGAGIHICIAILAMYLALKVTHSRTHTFTHTHTYTQTLTTWRALYIFWRTAPQAFASLARKVRDAGGIDSKEGLPVAIEHGGQVEVYSPWNKKEGFCDLHLSTVLEIRTGQVDRGATLKYISQFPAENEHVLLPLSNFELTVRRMRLFLMGLLPFVSIGMKT